MYFFIFNTCSGETYVKSLNYQNSEELLCCFHYYAIKLNQNAQNLKNNLIRFGKTSIYEVFQ